MVIFQGFATLWSLLLSFVTIGWLLISSPLEILGELTIIGAITSLVAVPRIANTLGRKKGDAGPVADLGGGGQGGPGGGEMVSAQYLRGARRKGEIFWPVGQKFWARGEMETYIRHCAGRY